MPNYVRTAPDGYHFLETATGDVYVPMGVNYFPTGSGWAPQIWREGAWRPEAFERDFPRLTALGMNTIRVFLSLSHLMPEPMNVSERALEQVGVMLDSARAHGLRVIFSGPNRWEGWPDWYEQRLAVCPDAYFADEMVLRNLERFYRTFSARFAAHEGLFGVDLLNEPMIHFDPAMLHADRDALWAYQQRRNQISYEFVRRCTAAVKAEDPNHLVSIGSHQWSIPLNGHGPDTYFGFDPHVIGELVDYLSFHWYPYCDAEHKIYEDDEASYQWNMGQFLASARYMCVGKPVMYEEFGLYGGGEFHKGPWDLPYLSQHTQARWIADTMLRGKPFITGWLNWGFQDHPCCGDPTRFQGFYDDEGNEKELCRVYPTVRRQVEDWIKTHTPAYPPRSVPLDLRQVATDPAAMKRAREEAIARAQRGEAFLFAVHTGRGGPEV